MKNIKKLFVVFCLLMMSIGMAACSSQAKENAGSGEEQKSFSKFQGVDFDGNKVDESIFRKNKVTLVNLWHNECNACIEEMPMLEELNKELKAKGAEVIGLNVNAQGQENDPVVTEAKEILKKQGAAYRNIAVNAGDEVFKLIENTVLFPTNVLVDQNGNIIGEPFAGALMTEEAKQDILNVVDKINAGENPESDLLKKSEESKKAEEIRNIILSHNDLWNTLFENVDFEHQEGEKKPDTITDKLKKSLNQNKDKLTEEEIKTAEEDIQKVEALEK